MLTKDETHALKVYDLYKLLLELPAEKQNELYSRVTSSEGNENNVQSSRQLFHLKTDLQI